MSTCADHPRSRGVYSGRCGVAWGPFGSSPLARGLLDTARLDKPDLRIIPARAGFTLPRTAHRLPTGDHPRSRGVYERVIVFTHSRKGSSPLARGLRGDRVAHRAHVGIIPARAGFTPERPRRGRPAGDHPRSRGVYWMRMSPFHRKVGSSPLARGLLTFEDDSMDKRRIIPARAGFTLTRQRPSDSRTDHPRSRGVYPFHHTVKMSMSGSSPLARGLRPAQGAQGPLSRIIPARAGFTSALCASAISSTDHPRSRGVYLTDDAAADPEDGSSPLARGLRGLRHRGLP